MLGLEREAAAATEISTAEALFVILITQHAPFSRKIESVSHSVIEIKC